MAKDDARVSMHMFVEFLWSRPLCNLLLTYVCAARCAAMASEQKLGAKPNEKTMEQPINEQR